MALSKGTNSYATVEEADAFFANRIDVAAWNVAEESEKSKALVTSTMILDSLIWAGVAVSDSQVLAFPRTGSYFDTRLGMSVVMDGVPSRIVTACYELAYHLLNNDGILDDTGGVKDLSISSVNLTTILNPSLIPGVVRRIIKPLLLNSGSRSWWRAN